MHYKFAINVEFHIESGKQDPKSGFAKARLD